MKRFYDFVVESQNLPGIPLGSTTLLSSGYMNLEFFQKALNLLNGALAKVKPDSPLHANIEREYVPVYECLIGRWNILQRQNPGRPLPWDKQKLHQDFERLAMAAYNYYFPSHFPKVYRKKRSDEIERKKMFFLEQAPQRLPEEIAGREVIIVPLYDFAKDIHSIRFVKDADANGELAIEHFGEKLIKHAKHVEMGLYSQSNKTWINDVRIPLPEFPKDEKYHVYHLGTLKFADKPGRVVSYAWPSWGVNCNIDRYLPRQMIADNGVVDVYLSAKLQGTTFIQGSEKEDAFRVDALYIVLNKANTQKTP